MQDSENIILKAKKELQECIMRYKKLCVEAGKNPDLRYIELIKFSRNDLDKYIKYVTENKLFSSHILEKLQFLYGDLLTDPYNANVIQKFEDFVGKIELNLTSETMCQYLEKTKFEIDRLYDIYNNKHKLSNEDVNELFNQLDFYLNSGTKDTCWLYEKLVVPVHGLMSENNNVVIGCFSDIKKYLNELYGKYKKTVEKPKGLELKNATESVSNKNTIKENDWLQKIMQDALGGAEKD